jgi:hypothetical protein
MAVPKTVGEKFAVVETVESVVLETTCRRHPARDGPVSTLNASAGFFRKTEQ